MDDTLKQILASHPHLWRAGDRAGRRPGRSGLDTGYPPLNKQLHGGGWPRGVSNELYTPGPGMGELRLLIPALRQLVGDGYICWVAPPCIPFAPVLARQGIDLQRLLIVPVRNLRDRLWAMEQALLSAGCVAVFGWFGRASMGLRELRRLQLAARHSGSWSVLFRHDGCRQRSSPSALRAHLCPDARGRLAIEILRQPGGWAGQTLTLSIAPHYEQWQRLPVALLPSYTASPQPVIAEGVSSEGVSSEGVSSEGVSTGASTSACITTAFPSPATTGQPH